VHALLGWLSSGLSRRLVRSLSLNRIIQNGIVRLPVVVQLLGLEGHLGQVEGEAPHPQGADLNVQRVKVEPHATPEGNLGLLGVVYCCSIDEPKSYRMTIKQT